MALLTPITMMKLVRIRTKLENGSLTMQEAEIKARPFMEKLNNAAATNARKSNKAYTPISFEQFLVIQRAHDKPKAVREKITAGITRATLVNGDLSSVVKNRLYKHTYAVSTVNAGDDIWQTAVALVVNKTHDFDKPLFIENSTGLENARKTHSEAEKMAENVQPSKWPELPSYIS